MIVAEFEPGSLSSLQSKLNKLGADAPKALRTAINQTAKQANKDLAAEAQKTYVVKQSTVTKAMKIQNATVSKLEAVINAKGSPQALSGFKVTPATPRYGSRRPSVVKARVLQKNSPKSLEKGGIKAFVTKFQSGHVAVAERQGKERIPINQLYSLSVPAMLGNEKRVYGVVGPSIESNLQKNVEKQVEKYLAKG